MHAKLSRATLSLVVLLSIHPVCAAASRPFRVMAIQQPHTQSIEYRVIAEKVTPVDEEQPYSRERNRFYVFEGLATEISIPPRGLGPEFSSGNGGGWKYSGGRNSKEMILDIDGDGIFDTKGDNRGTAYFRFGNELIKTNARGLPEIRTCERIGDAGFRHYFFQNDRWGIAKELVPNTGEPRKGQQLQFAAQRDYSLPKVRHTAHQKLPSAAMLKNVKDSVWKDSDLLAPSPCKVTDVPCTVIPKSGGDHEIRFLSFYDVPFSVTLRYDHRVKHWSFGHNFSQGFSLNADGARESSQLRIGDLEYIDVDGDDRFDSLHNHAAGEWVAIEQNQLTRTNGPPKRNKGLDPRILVLTIGLSVFGLSIVCAQRYRARKSNSAHQEIA